jgi:hypothetical protein
MGEIDPVPGARINSSSHAPWPSFGCTFFYIDSSSGNDCTLIPVKKGVYLLLSVRELVSRNLTDCVTWQALELICPPPPPTLQQYMYLYSAVVKIQGPHLSLYLSSLCYPMVNKIQGGISSSQLIPHNADLPASEPVVFDNCWDLIPQRN